MLPHPIAGRQLEFPIGIIASVGKLECSRCSGGNRRNNEVIRGVALLVGDPQRQSLKNLAIKFDVPRGAAGISKFADYFILVVLGSKRCTIVAEQSYGAFWKVRKARNQQWDAVIKQADTALQQCFSV